MDLGGTNILNVGPERYLGRYVNTSVDYSAWTALTSASFGNVAVAVSTVLPSSLQFLTLAVYNDGPTPLYLMLSTGGTAAPATSGLVVPPSGTEPTLFDFQAGGILPTQTPSSPPGIRSIAIRGDAVESLRARCIILATFAGSYGP